MDPSWRRWDCDKVFQKFFNSQFQVSFNFISHTLDFTAWRREESWIEFQGRPTSKRRQRARWAIHWAGRRPARGASLPPGDSGESRRNRTAHRPESEALSTAKGKCPKWRQKLHSRNWATCWGPWTANFAQGKPKETRGKRTWRFHWKIKISGWNSRNSPMKWLWPNPAGWLICCQLCSCNDFLFGLLQLNFKLLQREKETLFLKGQMSRFLEKKPRFLDCRAAPSYSRSLFLNETNEKGHFLNPSRNKQSGLILRCAHRRIVFWQKVECHFCGQKNVAACCHQKVLNSGVQFTRHQFFLEFCATSPGKWRECFEKNVVILRCRFVSVQKNGIRHVQLLGGML